MSHRAKLWVMAGIAGAMAGAFTAGCEPVERTYASATGTGGAGTGGLAQGGGGATSDSTSDSGSGNTGGANTGGAGAGGANTGGAGGGCTAPLDPTIYSGANPECGALPLGPETSAIPIQVFGGNATYSGGEILPGQYELVKTETAYGDAPSKSQQVLVFDSAGHATLDAMDYDIPALDGADLQLYGQGTYTTSGSTLTTTYSVCKSGQLAVTSTVSYTAYTEGCDTFLVRGNASNRSTLKRRRAP